MVKRIKQLKNHEDINLHIKKRTFNIWLRAILFTPIIMYLIVSQWVSINSRNDFLIWWGFGAVMNSVIYTMGLLIGLAFIIEWDF